MNSENKKTTELACSLALKKGDIPFRWDRRGEVYTAYKVMSIEYIKHSLFRNNLVLFLFPDMSYGVLFVKKNYKNKI